MHLDLRRMFGIKGLLSAETTDKVWEITNKHLQRKEMFPQSILKKIGAKIIFTTDDPVDDLIYHKMAKNIEGITFLPTFRPDAYCNIFEDNWKSNVEEICQLTAQDITFKDFIEALKKGTTIFLKEEQRQAIMVY